MELLRDYSDVSERLSLALEQMKYVQETLYKIPKNAPIPGVLYKRLTDATEELVAVTAYRDLTVSGTMLIPTTDEYGHVISQAQAEGVIHSCQLEEVIVCQSDVSYEVPHNTIGLYVVTGGTGFKTLVENSSIGYRAFLPVGLCTVRLTDDLEDIVDAMMPEPDDPIAEEIDLALMDDQVNLGQLDTVVREHFREISEMEREMYYRYIERAGYLGGGDVIIEACSFDFIDINTGESDGMNFDVEQVLTGTFQGYVVTEVEDDNGDAQHLLCVQIYSEELEGIITIHVRDIQSFKIRRIH